MKKMVRVGIGVLATFFVAGLVGCTQQDENTIRFGGVFSLTGSYAFYGAECKNGVDLAIQEINAAGGINGKQVVLISEDDEGNPDKAVNAFKKLTTRDRVKIVIGSLVSGCTQPLTTLAQAGGIVQMAPAATAPAITDAGNYIFRACFIDPFQGTVGGRFARETLGVQRAAVLYDPGNDYSVGLQENFVAAFTAGGGEIVAFESYATGDIDFNAQITKIKGAAPDVVYVPDYYDVVALIARQLRAQGVLVPMVGADGWDGLIGLIGENGGDEVLNSFYSNHYAVDSTEPEVAQFVRAFREKYNKAPNSFAALGYDSVYLLRDAIDRAGTAEPAAVRDALEATDGRYVTGNLTFDAHHNPIKSAVMLELVRNADGQLVTSYKTTVNP
ncbi:MAG: ABC transporter substrate-binding protein [Treponema sp.]|nr:ABC transporter substrate-binding protein [Treponema sp.]